MKKPRVPRLSYANVVSTLCLFLLLGGGTALAASQILPRNSVGTDQLQRESVTGSKVRDGSLVASDFQSGQLPAGPRGGTGPEGPAGQQGDPGANGAKGEKGDRGAAGPTGETGAKGETGARGEAGATGNRGPKGDEGPEGPTGPRGKAGENGEAGNRGERGREGPEGSEGPRGERGARGERGPQGEPGEEGPEGKAGAVRTLTRYGNVATLSRRPFASYAACGKGEYVTGGGFDFLEFSREAIYDVFANRSSLVTRLSEEELKELEAREEFEGGEIFGEGEEGEFFAYRSPRDGATATGWAVSLIAPGKEPGRARYRAYVNCAVAGTATKETEVRGRSFE